VPGISGVSRSGYNAWKKHMPSKSRIKKEEIMRNIMDIYNDSHQNYGAPGITSILNRKRIEISEKTVSNYMREMGIKAQYIRPYTVTTINSDFNSELKNIPDDDFNPDEPDEVWCTDITCIWTFAGFVYLTGIMDLYSGKIISWVLSDTPEAKYVIEAVEKAKKSGKINRPLVIHSDRGSQYVSVGYSQITAGMKRSYSNKAYPRDNACIESFHALIKREWLNRYKIFDFNHACRLVFEYTETFYNTVRIHSHCDYMSPDDYEERYWNET